MHLDPHVVCLEDEPIHTVTGLVKQWLRELPDPLMTFTLYNDFLLAVGEETEIEWEIYDWIEKYTDFTTEC